jgi:hypothetical protein
MVNQTRLQELYNYLQDHQIGADHDQDHQHLYIQVVMTHGNITVIML